MATFLHILKNKNGIALRLPVKPPPVVVYCSHFYYIGANMEIVFSKSKQNDIFTG
jgi:hypothetical protein